MGADYVFWRFVSFLNLCQAFFSFSAICVDLNKTIRYCVDLRVSLDIHQNGYHFLTTQKYELRYEHVAFVTIIDDNDNDNDKDPTKH